MTVEKYRCPRSGVSSWTGGRTQMRLPLVTPAETSGHSAQDYYCQAVPGV